MQPIDTATAGGHTKSVLNTMTQTALKRRNIDYQ